MVDRHTKTLKIRVKDKHARQLNRMAVSVNQVWNFINALSYKSIQDGRGKNRGFMSGFDFQKYTGGSSKLLGLGSATIQMTGHEYATRRKQFKKARLQWRKSGGVRRSLGWIPFTAAQVKLIDGKIKFTGHNLSVFGCGYNLSEYKFRSGTFSEDSRGRWYFNVVVSFIPTPSKGKGSVGIDLGCKSAATDSNGDQIIGREYRELERKLGIAQRARNKKRARAIHAKIKNCRNDRNHKYSRKLVDENALIVVGNVSSKALVKTKMAKSVLDAGWFQLKTMLLYKSDHAGIIFDEVNEAYTTQACSSCGCISQSSPKGRAGLGIREWTCVECGSTHDRDINAAKNILALGHERLVEENVA